MNTPSSRELRLQAPPHYHHNGSAGDGFFAVHFAWRTGRTWQPLVATLAAPADGETYDRAKVYVVDPADRNACFDGPYFAEWLIGRCRATDESREAYDRGIPAAQPKRIPANPGAAPMLTRADVAGHRLTLTAHFDSSWSWFDPATGTGGEGFKCLTEAHEAARLALSAVS